MNQITSWESQKTEAIMVDGKQVTTASLPQGIRFKIETYDRIKADYLEHLYKQELLHLAMTGKLAEIHNDIKTLTRKPTEESV